MEADTEEVGGALEEDKVEGVITVCIEHCLRRFYLLVQ